MTLDATEAAKLIRADIATALKAGDLPAGVKISVRREYASLMSAIHVTIRNAPAEWAVREVGDAYESRKVVTPAVRELGRRLRDIATRHFQTDPRHSFIEIHVEVDGSTRSVPAA